MGSGSENNDKKDKEPKNPFDFFNSDDERGVGRDKKPPKKPFFSIWFLMPLVIIVLLLINQLFSMESANLKTESRQVR